MKNTFTTITNMSEFTKTITMRHHISGNELEIKELDSRLVLVKILSGPHKGSEWQVYTSPNGVINSYQQFGFDIVKQA